jgi:hypothetical protein
MTDPCIYKALVSVALPTHVCEPGELLIEGRNIPFDYVPPSGDCEPMNEAAVRKYHATVPRQSASRTISPKTAWRVTHYPTHDEWSLSGLGSTLDPICT